ncbi:MAG: sugar transferase [Cytophagaceae bacterium]|nr:sugar transferase [Cytophagaceae bacterium]
MGTVEALKKNLLAGESSLYIFSDGPRNESDKEKIPELRKYIHSITGFKQVNIVEREKNTGLANSIIKGVTDVINRYGKVIVLEDDIETSPYFLKYMNDALDLYEQEDKVISIAAYMFPVKKKIPDYFFLRGADCWGWATWKRGWDLFEYDGSKLLKELEQKKLTSKFDYNNTANFTDMLKKQNMGKIDSWAIRWTASAFLKEKYTLYPGKSLVMNTGTDGSGTHNDMTQYYSSQINNHKIHLHKIPIEENKVVFDAIVEFYKPSKRSFINRLMQTLNFKS